MASAYLFVDKPVASIQCDVDTAGSAVLTLGPAFNKLATTNRLPDGKLRIVIFGMGQETFSGQFVSVDALCISVTNVVGSNPDATNANCAVLWLNSPVGVTVTLG